MVVIWYNRVMEITHTQYQLIEHCLPRQRGNVSLTNLQVLNAILYVAEQGCKWRALPKHYGKWHTVYTRMNRWSKNGVLNRVFEQLQVQQIIRIKVDAVSIDSTSIKVHPDGTGALKKTALNRSVDQEEAGQQRFIWLPQMTPRL
jgi:transposase